MKHTLRQVLRSGKFVVGFCVFAAVLLIVTVYPLIVPAPPLEPIGQGTFFPPGIYVNVYDSVAAAPYYSLNLGEAAARRIAGRLGEADRASMKEWLAASGLAESEIDTADIRKLLNQWTHN